ncbi:MAG: gas vesicle protein GvpK [Vicinamibacterales bacterium]
MVGSPVADKAAARAPHRQNWTRPEAAHIQSPPLLDVIDTVIDKGLAVVARDLGSVSSAPPATLAPDDTSRSVIRLVLTLVEFVRQLLERQAVRRVREQTLNAEEIEPDTEDSTTRTTMGASE